MSRDGLGGRFATDLSVQVVVVETVVRCIELRAEESGPCAWVQTAAHGREWRSVGRRAGSEHRDAESYGC